MLFCTGPKSGRPRSVCFARCQFSLNHPRLSPCTGRSNTTRPGMFVSTALKSFSKSITHSILKKHQNTGGNRHARTRVPHVDGRGKEHNSAPLARPRGPGLTGPAACNAPRSRPWPAPTRHGSRYTIRSSARGPIRSPYASESNPARCAAWSSRSRNGGRGPDGP